jgi:hypothetical protein
MVIKTNRIAPVARVFPSSATASFPPERFCAMMPEPMTQANRKKEPTASATSLLKRGGMSDGKGIAAKLTAARC